ncbi:MAG: hypothetical protein JWO31_953, partial [Phycisphaerales bacterium]|nr:hypothetical protein [Phycisphaerales bacterium]
MHSVLEVAEQLSAGRQFKVSDLGRVAGRLAMFRSTLETLGDQGSRPPDAAGVRAVVANAIYGAAEDVIRTATAYR